MIPIGGILSKKEGDEIIFLQDEFPHLDSLCFPVTISKIEKGEYGCKIVLGDEMLLRGFSDLQELKFPYEGHINGSDWLYDNVKYNKNRIYVKPYHDDMFRIMLFTNMFYYNQFMRDQCRALKNEWLLKERSFINEMKKHGK